MFFWFRFREPELKLDPVPAPVYKLVPGKPELFYTPNDPFFKKIWVDLAIFSPIGLPKLSKFSPAAPEKEEI